MISNITEVNSFTRIIKNEELKLQQIPHFELDDIINKTWRGNRNNLRIYHIAA